MEANQVRLTDWPRHGDSSEKSLLRRFAKQIVMSIIASIIGGLIVNFTGVKKVVLTACSAANLIFGDPLKGEGGIVHKIEDKYDDLTKRHPNAPGGVPSLNPLRKSPAEIEALARQKDAERQRKEAAERNRYIARADACGLKHDDDWTLEKFKIEVPLAEQRAEDAQERKVLLAQARELKMAVDDDWNNKTFKEELKEERAFQKADTDYQEARRAWKEAMERYNWNLAHGPNARCPNPRCGHTQRFGRSRINTQFLCSKCGQVSSVRMAMAHWVSPPAPQEPQPPKRKPSLLKRIFG